MGFRRLSSQDSCLGRRKEPPKLEEANCLVYNYSFLSLSLLWFIPQTSLCYTPDYRLDYSPHIDNHETFLQVDRFLKKTTDTTHSLVVCVAPISYIPRIRDGHSHLSGSSFSESLCQDKGTYNFLVGSAYLWQDFPSTMSRRLLAVRYLFDFPQFMPFLKLSCPKGMYIIWYIFWIRHTVCYNCKIWLRYTNWGKSESINRPRQIRKLKI